MGYRDLLRHVNFKALTDTQRNQLKKKFEQRKRDLEAAIKTIDQGLQALAKGPQPKKAAKRKTAKGPT